MTNSELLAEISGRVAKGASLLYEWAPGWADLINLLPSALAWFGAGIAVASAWRSWRYAQAMNRMLLDLDDAAMDARLSGSYARTEMRKCMEAQRTLKHLTKEVQTVLAFAPQPLAVSDFHPDDVINGGPFPIGDTPLGSDGASSHDHGEEGEPWESP